jgi:pyruvate-ferredoxin/flavodoxin oxidoreductase
LASKTNLNALVVDDEIFSQTGGHQSKATQIGTVVQFIIMKKYIQKRFRLYDEELW